MIIMHIKRLINIFLSLMIAFGFTVLFSITVTAGLPVRGVPIKEECHKITCEICQLERLLELLRGDITEIKLELTHYPLLREVLCGGRVVRL